MFCVWAAEGEGSSQGGLGSTRRASDAPCRGQGHHKRTQREGRDSFVGEEMAFEAWIAPKEQKCCQNGRNWPGRALPPERQQAEHRQIASETQKGEGSAAGDGNLPLEQWERSLFSLDSERQSPGPLLRATRTVLFWGTRTVSPLLLSPGRCENESSSISLQKSYSFLPPSPQLLSGKITQ